MFLTLPVLFSYHCTLLVLHPLGEHLQASSVSPVILRIISIRLSLPHQRSFVIMPGVLRDDYSDLDHVYDLNDPVPLQSPMPTAHHSSSASIHHQDAWDRVRYIPSQMDVSVFPELFRRFTKLCYNSSYPAPPPKQHAKALGVSSLKMLGSSWHSYATSRWCSFHLGQVTSMRNFI